MAPGPIDRPRRSVRVVSPHGGVGAFAKDHVPILDLEKAGSGSSGDGQLDHWVPMPTKGFPHVFSAPENSDDRGNV